MLEKTFRPAEVEADHYRRWEQAGAFGAHDQGNAQPYTIMMPPPNVTGSLHMGHALTFALQDVLIRYHRMRGRDALWQPGTDHAGIATQMVVERKLAEEGKTRHDLGREAFLDAVWKWREESGGAIIRQLRRLGASADWPRERFTMDEGLSHAVRKVFVDLFRKGLIYRDKRLVNWDPKLHTAISDLEVQQQETNGNLWHLRYPIAGEEGRFIVVATTRPETMLGDTAVAVHPDDERYKEMVGKQVVLPLVGRLIPIVADDYADPKTGSGAVKITPAHDFNDFEVGRRHGLALVNVLDADARISEEAPKAYRGLDRYEARKKVVADLEAGGFLEKVEPHRHMVPHGDRSGVAIEPWLTDQWYVDAKTLAAPALRAVEEGRTKFMPQQWESTYYEWMRNIQPWCVSRQIWWGHRIPAWYGPDNEIFVALDKAEAEQAARQHYGKEVALRQDEDVLDTWFSSALWPFSTLGWPEETAALKRFYPGDVLVTGFDIIFFWVARMMMMGIHFMGDVPFRTVYIHALVRDQAGQKMSKSKGNIIDPLETIDRYGCDAVRFTLAALAVPGRDVKLSESRIEGYRNFGTKLWNAARYCLMNGAALAADYDPAKCQQVVNRWIVGKVNALSRDLENAFAAYRFNDVAHLLYHFVWDDFCDWYLEFTKPMLSGGDERAAAEIRATMAWTLGRILHLLHPVAPFVTEELWRHLPGGEGMLITAPWPAAEAALDDADARAEVESVIRIVSEIRAVRAEMNVPPGAQLPLIVREAGPATVARLDRYRELIGRLARLERIGRDDGAASGAVQLVVDDAILALPLAGVVDLAAERARLAKEVEKTRQEIDKVDRKLQNEQFVTKAPVEVVEEQKERRAEAQLALKKLSVALERLPSA